MSYMIIGSSNLQRLYTPARFPSHPAYAMIKCVNMDLFKVRLNEINPNVKFVIVSVLENFFADKAKLSANRPVEESLEMMKEVISETLALVSATAERLPETLFVMVQPIKRPAIKWYMEQFENLCLEHERLVDDVASTTTNIARVDAFSPEAQKFVDDGIHLTEESMRIFIESTII